MRCPRAAQDIDIVPTVRSFKRALQTLRSGYPHLTEEPGEVEVKFRDPRTSLHLIDVVKPGNALLRSATRYFLQVRGTPEFRIPSVEMALAMKFAAIRSDLRPQAEMFLDAHDYILMVKTNPDIDLETLAELGQLVYNGGGAEILEKVRQVRAGERLQL